jgi:hypothetical protein
VAGVRYWQQRRSIHGAGSVEACVALEYLGVILSKKKDWGWAIGVYETIVGDIFSKCLIDKLWQSDAHMIIMARAHLHMGTYMFNCNDTAEDDLKNAM